MVKVKFCGNQSMEDLHLGLTSKADYLGLIFASSKRKVDPIEVGRWLASDKKNTSLVGVFVNPTFEEIDHVMNYVPLDIIQCHGHESISLLNEIKERFNRPVWKAIHHDENSLDHMKSYFNIADGYVVDSKVKGMWGGTGTRFDWQHVPQYIEEGHRQNVPCFIAGGITQENVHELLGYHPYGIDLASGIETNGKKDQLKMNDIERRVRT